MRQAPRCTLRNQGAHRTLSCLMAERLWCHAQQTFTSAGAALPEAAPSRHRLRAATYIRLRRRECRRARTDPVTGVIRPRANHPATPSASSIPLISTPPPGAPPTSTRPTSTRLTSTRLTSTQRTSTLRTSTLRDGTRPASTRRTRRLRFRCRHPCRRSPRGWECDALRPRAALTLLAGIPLLRVSLRDTQGTGSLSSTSRLSITSSLISRSGCPGPARPVDSLTGTHASRKGSGTRGQARTTAAVTTSLSLPVLLVPSLPARIVWPLRLLSRPKRIKDLQSAAGRNGASAASSGGRRGG
jgi:hypothetical protein